VTIIVKTTAVSTAGANLSALDPDGEETVFVKVLKLAEKLHKEAEEQEEKEALEAQALKAKQTKQGIIEAKYQSNNIVYSNDNDEAVSGTAAIVIDDYEDADDISGTSTPTSVFDNTPVKITKKTQSPPSAERGSNKIIHIDRSDDYFRDYMSTSSDLKRQKVKSEDRKIELEERRLRLQEQQMQMDKDKWEVERQERMSHLRIMENLSSTTSSSSSSNRNNNK